MLAKAAKTDCLSLNWRKKVGDMSSLGDLLRAYPTTHYEYVPKCHAAHSPSTAPLAVHRPCARSSTTFAEWNACAPSRVKPALATTF